MPATVHILILAAGSSSRMRGTDKLVQLISGQPLLRKVAEAAFATGAPVTVTLPIVSDARQAALTDLPLQKVEVPDAALGMSRSLRRGVEAVLAGSPGPTDGVMILPADMPDFTSDALSGMIRRFQVAPSEILRGCSIDGQPGHPAIFPRDLWSELILIEGDEGGRSLVQRHKSRVRMFPLPGLMSIRDLDTPEDWAAYNSGPAPLL
jgi:molybdenum cofactor cytidylyltransferase